MNAREKESEKETNWMNEQCVYVREAVLHAFFATEVDISHRTFDI